MRAEDPVLFEAVIVPHRSLSAAGLRILLGVVLAATTMLKMSLVVAPWLSVQMTLT